MTAQRYCRHDGGFNEFGTGFFHGNADVMFGLRRNRIDIDINMRWPKTEGGIFRDLKRDRRGDGGDDDDDD